MSIRNKQQICIHLKSYRSLSTFTIGRYMFRISVSTKIKDKTYYAMPINILEKKPTPLQSQNQPVTEDCHYISKAFTIKSGLNSDVDELCIFRFDVEVKIQDEQHIEQLNNRVHAELIHCQYSQSRVIGEYFGNCKGIVSDALVMDFYDSCPGQLIGTVHTCALSYEYLKESTSQIDAGKGSFQVAKLNKKQNLQYVQKVLEYLAEISNNNLVEITKNLNALKSFSMNDQLQKQRKLIQSTLASQQKQPLTTKQTEKQCQVRQLNLEQQSDQATDFDKTTYECPVDVGKNDEKENQIVLKVQQQSFQIDIQSKRKRKPIFNAASVQIVKRPIGLKKSSRVPKLQKNLHQNSQKIYQVWIQLNQNLMNSTGQQFIKKRKQEFEEKVRNKVGQSLIRFKGSKHIDVYSDLKEVQKRNIMIHQLRNLPSEHFEEHSQFTICNQKFFSKERPIFFQETVESTQINSKKSQKFDFLIIFLVHGLGACRLDMQKMKTQIKRHYSKKVRVCVSSANQSRTQGDIDNMGLRLAGQIDSEVTKHKGKFKISLIGHSMGGLIIRSALPRLQKLKDKFHSLVTFSSPHIGYAYSNSKLVDAGLWILNTMKKSISIQQMTMIDSSKIQDCFLYKLSNQPGLQWFEKVTFIASHQDSYVPFYSARIQKSSEIQADFKKGHARGISYCKMIDNILNKINGRLSRLDVNFNIPEQNIDSLIGRAAHVGFINNTQMVRTFCIAQVDSIF